MKKQCSSHSGARNDSLSGSRSPVQVKKRLRPETHNPGRYHMRNKSGFVSLYVCMVLLDTTLYNSISLGLPKTIILSELQTIIQSTGVRIWSLCCSPFRSLGLCGVSCQPFLFSRQANRREAGNSTRTESPTVVLTSTQ